MYFDIGGRHFERRCVPRSPIGIVQPEERVRAVKSGVDDVGNDDLELSAVVIDLLADFPFLSGA
jgi:hypothetical protein